MIKVSTEVNGKVASAHISEETHDILKDVSVLEDRPIEWFLVQTVKKYKELTELNLMKFISLRLDVASGRKR